MHPASFRSAVIVGGGSYGSGSPESGSLWRILVWKFSNPQEPQQPERMGRVRHGHHLPLVWTDNGLRWYGGTASETVPNSPAIGGTTTVHEKERLHTILFGPPVLISRGENLVIRSRSTRRCADHK